MSYFQTWFVTEILENVGNTITKFGDLATIIFDRFDFGGFNKIVLCLT